MGKWTGLLTGFSLCSRGPLHWLGMRFDASNRKFDLQCFELLVAVLVHFGHPCLQGHRLFLSVPPSFMCWFSLSTLSFNNCKKAFILPSFLLLMARRRGRGQKTLSLQAWLFAPAPYTRLMFHWTELGCLPSLKPITG